MPMKRLLFLIIIIFYLPLKAQHRFHINAATTAVGFPSVGYEKAITTHFSFHVDAIGSVFNSYQDKPLRFLIITPELRYYFNEDLSGFFVGGHLGGATFALQKYNYAGTSNYQKGFSYTIGTSVGYMFEVSNRLHLSVFIGGGSVQSYYKGYDYDTGVRYDLAENYNKSGELLLYRGGICIVFEL